MDDSSTPRNMVNGDYNITTNDASLSLANLSWTSSTKTNGKIAPAAIHSLLPPEIMAEIFMTVCDYIPQRWPPRVTSLLVLGKVCGTWREICWPIPSLWEVINLLVVPARLDVQNELLEEWISRAGSRNLYIYLNEEEPHKGWKEAPPHKIMHTIASISHKWETADIFLPEDNYADLIPIKDNLPVLKSLSIRPSKHECIDIDLRIFETCPLLQSLDIVQYYLENLFVPWKQLTRLYADGLLIEECFHVFRECQNLITCHLDKIVSDEDIVMLPVLIPHRSIESFDVTSSEVQEIALVFGNVTLPGLRKVQITCSDSSWTVDTITPFLASFFSRSSCNLQSLISNCIFHLEMDLIHILDALPSLIHLNVEERDFHFSVEFLDLLHHADFHELFLPNLQALTLCGMFSFNIYDMHRMLQGRPKSDKITTLKSFSVIGIGSFNMMVCELSKDLERKILDLVEDGLHFSISMPGSPETLSHLPLWLTMQFSWRITVYKKNTPSWKSLFRGKVLQHLYDWAQVTDALRFETRSQYQML